MSSMTSPLFSLLLILVVSFMIFMTYKLLKLPKGNTHNARRFIYKTNKEGEEEPLVIGHRAGQFEAPENTLIAIETAHRNGATAVELDLEFTRDEHAVIIHDDTVDRTTNGTGLLSKYMFDDLRKLDAASKAKTLRYADGTTKEAEFQQIPTLKEAVQQCMKLGMKIILDVKSNSKLTADALSQLLKEIPEMPEFVFVTSFYPGILYTVKQTCPEFLTALIWRHDYSSLTIDHQPHFTGLSYVVMQVLDVVGNIAVHSCLPDFLGINAVSMHKDHLSLRYVKQWRSKGIEVMAWTVNNPLEKEYLLKRCKIPIITDSILNSETCPEQAF